MEKSQMVKLLKERNLQVTPQRLAIFERLRDRKDHPTAEMIYSELATDFPSLTLVTIYNTLQKLEMSGLCCKVNPLHNSARYDGNPDFHMHVICSNCEKVVDLDGIAFSIDLPSWVTDEFEMRSQTVNLFGLCKECRKAAPADAALKKEHKVPARRKLECV